MQIKAPHISKELLEYLDKLYPERCPEVNWSDREIWITVGKRLVVRHLQEQYRIQNSNVLVTSLTDEGVTTIV